MSRTFSTKSGSVDNLKVPVRWGCKPKARQIRLNGAAAQARTLGHRARAPMCRISRSSLQCQRHQPLDFFIANLPWSPRSRLVQQSIHSPLKESLSPLPNRRFRNAQLRSHKCIRFAFGAPQNYPRPHGQRLPCLGASNPPFQHSAFIVRNRQRRHWSTKTHKLPPLLNSPLE